MLLSHTGKIMGNGMKYNIKTVLFKYIFFTLIILVIIGNKNKVK